MPKRVTMRWGGSCLAFYAQIQPKPSGLYRGPSLWASRTISSNWSRRHWHV